MYAPTTAQITDTFGQLSLSASSELQRPLQSIWGKVLNRKTFCDNGSDCKCARCCDACQSSKSLRSPAVRKSSKKINIPGVNKPMEVSKGKWSMNQRSYKGTRDKRETFKLDNISERNQTATPASLDGERTQECSTRDRHEMKRKETTGRRQHSSRTRLPSTDLLWYLEALSWYRGFRP
ncbi:unnamed protein product [Ixodes pacificus]